MDLNTHPCFNDTARHRYARIHLPVASRCNIQCRFCNRKFDCVNESRPGVTSVILTPFQALSYLKDVTRERSDISVVGIAGPGDPFANPEETMETLSLVREHFPGVMLCVASNGLNVTPFVDQLKTLSVSHVTITVNAVDPEVASQIYAWVRLGKRVLSGEAGVKTLLENQRASIVALKKAGITVKVNAIIIPGVNDRHIEKVAEQMAALHVDILNCVPYYPNEGAAFRDIGEPPPHMVKDIRERAGKFIRQMHHCTRCRADAVGLLGEKTKESMMEKLMLWSGSNTVKRPEASPRQKIAVASLEGMLINQHLGEADRLFIYENGGGIPLLLETRKTPERGGGENRWRELSETIQDCDTLLVSGIGHAPETILTERGMRVLVLEGLIQDAVGALFDGRPVRHMVRKHSGEPGAFCSGAGGGCG